MDIQKIKVRDEQLSRLVHDIERGLLRLPPFQRDFVWERTKVVKLLDSIYNEYPIGTFFIWEADKKYNAFYRNIAELKIPGPEPHADVNYILDGQQRITSLFVTVKGLTINNSDYSQICFDLDKERFIIRYKEGDYYVSLKDILGEDFLSVYNTLNDDRKKTFEKCRQIFTSYPLSIVTVRGKDLGEAATIFERINQGGKRLTIFDLVVAATWSKDFDLKKKFDELRREIREKGFGDIKPEIVTQALSLAVKGYCRRSYQLQLKNKEVKQTWDRLAESIKLAVDLLTKNMGVKIYDFIPYPSMIPLLAYLYFKIPRRSLNREMSEKVHDWFWKASLGERYGTSRDTRMEEDRRLVFDRLIEGKDPKLDYPIYLDSERIEKHKLGVKSALRNAFFCLLAIRRPRHFKTGDLVTLDRTLCSEYNNSEKHHIFPKNYLRKHRISGENLLANFCFIPAELNKEILSKPPSKYFTKYEKENPDFKITLKTHLIPYDGAIKDNDYQKFIQLRANMIYEEFEKLVGSRIMKILITDVNRAIDELENDIRELIDAVLSSEVGENYWSLVMPNDVQDRTQRRAKEYVRKNPSVNLDDLTTLDLLEYCDVMDYSTTILKNWKHFEDIFKSKFEAERRFIAFKDYRNTIRHGRNLTPVIRKEGEAAIEWLSQAISDVGEEMQEEIRENVKRQGLRVPETEKETIKRVESGFVKDAVKSIPAWVDKKLSDKGLYINQGNVGSHTSLKEKEGKLALFYYYANNWVYCELQSVTSGELKRLQKGLTKPESILDRQSKYGQVRFHLVNEKDYKLLQGIIEKRYL